MSQASPEPQHRDQPPGEDELWEAIADPSRRKVLDLILAHGRAMAHAAQVMAAAAARWDSRLDAIKRLAEASAHANPLTSAPLTSTDAVQAGSASEKPG